MQLLKCQKNRQFRLVTKIPRLIASLLCASLFTGCAGFVSVDHKFNPQPVDRNIHVVQKSETLFSLAWRYGWDYKALASANNIPHPYTIYPGQQLNINKRNTGSTSAAKSSSKTLTKSKRPKKPQGPSAYKRSPNTPEVATPNTTSSWTWPAKGKVIAKFSTKAPTNKGIDIAGSLGESVVAAGAGTVVYAGSGLLGYGNLVIIKHDDQFLSAYAHNKKLLVKENQEVKAGQTIAEIGSSGTDKVKLHFEIRHKGKPVDPLRYLPKAR